jgi:hypothetical protein
MLSELIRQIKRLLAGFLKPEQKNFDSRFTGLETKDRIFDECVNQFFKPLAQQSKLPLDKLKDGIYEIRGSAFTMRVRRGTGHSRDFLVCLSDNKSRPESLDVDRLDGEIGLGVIAEFYGEKLGMHAMHLNEGYLSAFEERSQCGAEFMYSLPAESSH